MLARLATLTLMLTAIAAALVIVHHTSPDAQAHCQVPCGIYDDPARITALYEDAATIEKSINEMLKLQGKTDAQSMQQFVRWTSTKESHASNIIKVISEYFLAQKIKPLAPGDDGYEAYLKQLADHHAVIVMAMRAKQQATPDAAVNLKNAIHTLEHYWNPAHAH